MRAIVASILLVGINGEEVITESDYELSAVHDPVDSWTIVDYTGNAATDDYTGNADYSTESEYASYGISFVQGGDLPPLPPTGSEWPQSFNGGYGQPNSWQPWYQGAGSRSNQNPEQRFWHGEKDIATVINKAGNMFGRYPVSNMFDDQPTTSWISSVAMKYKDKVLGIKFKRLITFNSLTIQKHGACCKENYRNICLVLDGKFKSQICTDTEWGFAGDYSSETITWTRRVEGVRKVELYFRTKSSQGFAHIADLKIAYTPYTSLYTPYNQPIPQFQPALYNNNNEKYLGGVCYAHWRPQWGALQVSLHGKLDIQKCVDICFILKYNYAGLQSGNQCFCDNDHPTVQAQHSECNIPCEANHNQICGGFRKVLVFSTHCNRGDEAACEIIKMPTVPDLSSH